MSFFVRQSIGVKIDPEILAEYDFRVHDLKKHLRKANLILPPENISLFPGSSLDNSLYRQITHRIGVTFSDVDLYYTYITLHDLFAEKIGRKAKNGAFYLVYGFSRVLPDYSELGLETVSRDVGGQGIAALYRKGP